MLKKINYVLDNEVGFCNPQIITQFPISIVILTLMTYFAIFGSDFYHKSSMFLFS